MQRSILFASVFAFAALATGCSDEKLPPGTAAGGTAPSATAAPTGDVVEVKMVSGGGERFEPAEVTVKRGDVIRFVLVAGVHNARFPAEKNPSGVKLPDATPYLQAPGQTHDVVIDLPAGDYTYHCDPHAALGMVGTVKVTS